MVNGKMDKKAFTLLEIIIGLIIAAAVIFIVSKVIIGILAPEEEIPEGYYILEEQINSLEGINENESIEFSLTLFEHESIESFFSGEDRQSGNRCPTNADCLCIVNRKESERSYCVKNVIVKDPHSSSNDLRVNLPRKYWGDCVDMVEIVRPSPGPSSVIANPGEVIECLEKYGIRVIELPFEPDNPTLDGGIYMFTSIRMYKEGDLIYMCPNEVYC